jgi:hypothetical protein
VKATSDDFAILDTAVIPERQADNGGQFLIVNDIPMTPEQYENKGEA